MSNESSISCPNCGQDNHKKSNFCHNCGQLLLANCPRCHSAISSTAHFCSTCGLSISPLGQGVWWQTAVSDSLPHAPRANFSELNRFVATPEPQSQSNAQPSAQSGPPSPAPASTLDRFLPRELADKLEAARSSGTMVGERRVVTMLFCDVTGSTAAAERLDPEEWTGIINGAFEHMIKPVYKYEGTVARLMGDAILAFFGAPIAHEDDPQRAILAGLEIIAGIRNYQEIIQANYGLEITARVGINTGLVVVGAVGSDLRMEYTAMGDAINLAARMEQTAEPGTVQIAEATFKRIGTLFEVEDLGGISVKGKSQPVKAYRVLRHRAGAGRLRGIAGQETRLIGREWELGQLTNAADRVLGGVGQLFCLLGEAGLGKSRLIRELRRHWYSLAGAEEQHAVSWLEAASFSYETVQPYALWGRLLRHMAGIEEGEMEASALKKLELLVAELPEDNQGELTAVLTSLLGLSEALEGQEFKEALFKYLPAFIEQRYKLQPGVLVLDDIHWSDSASIEFLLHLLPAIEKLPLLLICVMRPDQESAAWQVKLAMEEQNKPDSHVLTLRPLSTRDSSELIDALLEISDLPQALRVDILEKSMGNPFFVEEVVRTLLERDFVIQGDEGRHWIGGSAEIINIPGNVQALLTARIDRLAEEVRHTLQLASIFGRSFYQRVLITIARAEQAPANGQTAVIDAHLDTLEQQQMILEAARIPEQQYMFRHALTQEAAYKTILRRQRQAYHLSAGIALERFFAADLDEHVDTLAYHFWEAGDDQAALRYLIMAGGRSFRLYALQEAGIHYDRAMEIVRRAKNVDRELRLALCTQRGRTLELMVLYEAALQHYQEMEAIAAAEDDSPLKLAALTAQATLYNTFNPMMDAAKGEEAAGAAQQVARDMGDWEATARLLWSMALGATYMRDDPFKAIEYGEESLQLARKHGLEEQTALSAADLVPAYLSVGRVDEGRELLLEARSRFEALGDRPLLAQTFRNMCTIDYNLGRLQDAEREMKLGLEIERTIDNPWGLIVAKQGLAVIDYERGDIGRAIAELEWAMQKAITVGLGPVILFNQVQLALSYEMIGDWPKALDILDDAHNQTDLGSMTAGFSRSIEALVLLAKGDVTAAQKANEISQTAFDSFKYPTGGVFHGPIMKRLANTSVALALGHAKRALNLVDELLNYLAGVQIAVYRPQVLYLKGQILAHQERPTDARQIWRKALRESETMGERRMRWQIQAALAGVVENEEEAAELRREARQIVTYIADNAGRPEFKQSFLNRPEVQSLLPVSEDSSDLH